jgi:hypothetical protein
MYTLQEIYDTQATASLLGMKTEVITDYFTWIVVYEGMNYINFLKNQKGINVDDVDS